LVTNGLLLNEAVDSIVSIKWCRISNSDSRSFTGAYKSRIENIILHLDNVDWAFSHVVSSSPNVEEICRIIRTANKYRQVTHVRLVADLFQPQSVDMNKLKTEVTKQVDCSKVIFQGRDKPEKGGDCYICYLKPVISADGKIYACCGVQYALTPPSKYLPEELCLGEISDIDSIIENSSVPLIGVTTLIITEYYKRYYPM